MAPAPNCPRCGGRLVTRFHGSTSGGFLVEVKYEVVCEADGRAVPVPAEMLHTMIGAAHAAMQRVLDGEPPEGPSPQMLVQRAEAAEALAEDFDGFAEQAMGHIRSLVRALDNADAPAAGEDARAFLRRYGAEEE